MQVRASYQFDPDEHSQFGLTSEALQHNWVHAHAHVVGTRPYVKEDRQRNKSTCGGKKYCKVEGIKSIFNYFRFFLPIIKKLQ